MKVNYICEICGKPHDSELEAKACETEHELAAKRKEAEEQREAKLLDAINCAVNLYVSQHKKMPTITLTKENEEIVLSGLDRIIARFFGASV